MASGFPLGVNVLMALIVGVARPFAQPQASGASRKPEGESHSYLLLAYQNPQV